MLQIQSKFCPEGVPVGEVDSGIIVKGQLDCSLGEDQNMLNIVGSVVKHTPPSERYRGYRPGLWIWGERIILQSH